MANQYQISKHWNINEVSGCRIYKQSFEAERQYRTTMEYALSKPHNWSHSFIHWASFGGLHSVGFIWWDSFSRIQCSVGSLMLSRFANTDSSHSSDSYGWKKKLFLNHYLIKFEPVTFQQMANHKIPVWTQIKNTYNYWLYLCWTTSG